MSGRASARLAKLENATGEPVMEDWLDVLDSPDQEVALAELQARFPVILSARYKSAVERLG